MIAARQESVGLSNDGKTLLGPVLPHILAKQNQSQGRGETN
jgi:hypothetical protein